MKAKSGHTRPGATGSLAQAKRTVLRVTVLYVALVGAWVLLQSGIPLAFFIDYKTESLTWTQLFMGDRKSRLNSSHDQISYPLFSFQKQTH